METGRPDPHSNGADLHQHRQRRSRPLPPGAVAACWSSANPCQHELPDRHEQCPERCRATRWFAMDAARREPRPSRNWRRKAGRPVRRGHQHGHFGGNHKRHAVPPIYLPTPKIDGKPAPAGHHPTRNWAQGGSSIADRCSSRGAGGHQGPPAPSSAAFGPLNMPSSTALAQHRHPLPPARHLLQWRHLQRRQLRHRRGG